MIRSMTGFGVAEGPLAGGRLAVEVRTVNHRHFNPQIRVPSALQRFEGEVRERVRVRVARGNVALSARWSTEPPAATTLRVDVERARAVTSALTELQQALGLPGEIDVAFVARQPGVLTVPEESALDLDSDAFLSIVDGALDEVLRMREQEGKALAKDLADRLSALGDSLAAVTARAPERLVAERERLKSAVTDLIGSATIDDTRLELEIALLADKLDIAEETVRLRAHLDAVRAALGDADAVGRRLAFLGQEMLREVNTIGSKANDAVIARLVIDMKSELEKFREQVENVE